jgi:hypothetical protein
MLNLFQHPLVFMGLRVKPAMTSLNVSRHGISHGIPLFLWVWKFWDNVN